MNSYKEFKNQTARGNTVAHNKARVLAKICRLCKFVSEKIWNMV